MYLSKVLLVAILSTSTLVLAAPGMSNPNVDGLSLFSRSSCSGNRLESEQCGGKKLQKQNSFHNCKNSGGKCCAEESDGGKGLNVGSGLGREDCGYCFSSKCSN